jgi:hypothetical protein
VPLVWIDLILAVVSALDASIYAAELYLEATVGKRCHARPKVDVRVLG